MLRMGCLRNSVLYKHTQHGTAWRCTVCVHPRTPITHRKCESVSLCCVSAKTAALARFRVSLSPAKVCLCHMLRCVTLYMPIAMIQKAGCWPSMSMLRGLSLDMCVYRVCEPIAMIQEAAYTFSCQRCSHESVCVCVCVCEAAVQGLLSTLLTRKCVCVCVCVCVCEAAVKGLFSMLRGLSLCVTYTCVCVCVCVVFVCVKGPTPP